MKNAPFKFVLQAVSLMALGFACGTAGGFIGARAVGSDDFYALGLAILGMLFGYFLGITVGLVLLRTVFRQRGSVVLGFIGAVAWTGLTLLVVSFLDLNNDLDNLFTIVLFAGVPFAALGLFKARRRSGVAS